MKKPAVKKITDLKDKLEAYRASALAAGKGSARPGNLALASAAAGGAALAVAPAAEAAIQYSGVRDIMLMATNTTNHKYNIDVDGDGNDEFSIINATPEPGVGLAFIYQLKESASVLGSYIFDGFPYANAKALTANYNIGSISSQTSRFWTSNSDVVIGFGTVSDHYGNFPGAENKYIGVRFTKVENGPLHYGWIRVNLAANIQTITIVDWAWEDEADKPIPAGKGADVIPTLNEWGIIVLMTLLAGAAAWKMNKPELLQA